MWKTECLEKIDVYVIYNWTAFMVKHHYFIKTNVTMSFNKKLYQNVQISTEIFMHSCFKTSLFNFVKCILPTLFGIGLDNHKYKHFSTPLIF